MQEMRLKVLKTSYDDIFHLYSHQTKRQQDDFHFRAYYEVLRIKHEHMKES